jgi:putative ABC transport system permease protein
MGLARQSVYVRSDRTMMAYQGQGPGRQVWLTNDDMDVVRSVPGVMFVAPRLFFGENFGEGQNVVAGTKTGNFFVIATTPEFATVEAIELLRGRNLDQGDVTEERKVAVIGRNVRRVLFGDESPVGRYVSFRGVYFRVVGETRSMRTGQQSERMDNAVYLPLSTAQRAYNKRGIVAFASVSLLPDAPAAEVQQDVMARLKKRHHVHPEDPQGIRSFNVAEEFRRITNLFLGIRIFVWFVGIATLLAGVLGVSNILLITVKERTQELGIRKALGATPSSILRMVVAESLVLTSLAGYGGIVVGVAVLELASRVTQGMPQAPISEPEVDMKVVLAAGAILILGGLVAAIMPARHATRIHPVEALRAE